ncbi:multidrug resistance-associated ABC transporter [Mycena leptocephala]|nr:multidrug resistance-associated ABC transporter [Mycena leptocephala]
MMPTLYFQNWPGGHLESLAIPAASSALSAVVLIFDLLFGFKNGPKEAKDPSSVLKITRLVGCFALFVLSTREKASSRFSFSTLETSLSLTYIYVSLLALISIFTRPPFCDRAARHSSFVLIATLSVYFYRDVLPLGAFSDTPQDSGEGIRLWIRIALLAFSGLLVPLLSPRRYTPVDPLNPMKIPNPEQTASILSLAFFSFLDPTIVLAYRLTRLPYDLLPPLADYDSAQYLRSRNFQHIRQRRHLFFGIIRVFRVDILILAAASAVIVPGSFIVPVGLQKLLHYIETKGEGATVRPWVWVLWLFVGPTIHSLGDQFYMFIVSRATVRAEAILTELVFEHALRIRIKSEPDAKGSGPGRNLHGRLNNMITTDIRLIIASKSLILSLVYMPMIFILSVWFLYSILGWSAFVGMATIFAMLPIPGYVGKWVQAAQRDLTQKRDARVQTHPPSNYNHAGHIHDLVSSSLSSILDRSLTIRSTIIMQQELTASKFHHGFRPVQDLGSEYLSSYTLYITSKVSFDRLDDFLRNTELLDVYSSEKLVVAVPPENQDDIGFHDATFSWSDAVEDSSARRFSLHIDHLIFKKGSINLILGQTGSGKTSLLLSLLGETYFTPSSPQAWYNLPRDGGVAYAAQESWVQSATIKENIVFGAEFDSERYRKVAHVHLPELKLFAAGDEQVVGERGLTLSGGQKARLLLRAQCEFLQYADTRPHSDIYSYSQASILLLDDVLAALDVHTAKWIVEKCFGGDLIAGRTVLLVTHNIALTRSVAQFTVSLGLEGRVISQGSIQEALDKDVKLSIEASEKPAASGKLIVEEELVEGVSVECCTTISPWPGWSSPHPVFPGVTSFLILHNFAQNLQTWYLGHWSSQYDTTPASEVPVLYYLAVYGSILLSLFLFYACGVLLYTFGILRASESLNRQLIDSVLGTTLRWLDTTPTSRIIARSTHDMGVVDGPLAAALWMVVDETFALFILGTLSGKLFMPAQISVKREMSNARSPVLGHFSAAVTGLTSIRAYGCQNAFIQESLRRLDRYSRSARLSFDLIRWSAVRTHMLSNLFEVSLAVYLVYFQDYSAANTGFSLERIEAYINIEQEPKPTKEGVPPAAWPTSGDLVVQSLSARYSDDGPEVLHVFRLASSLGSESELSSLTLALLRAIVTEGSVSYDGIVTSSINLDALRSKITIIPQMPELLSGTLRQNLDPFGQFEDTELTQALRAAGLYSLQTEGAENNITLVIALARAMIRQSKLLILDEATSAIDYKTDAVVQNSLRTKLGGDVTSLIVAHRLHTIMDADRIMVLDTGRIVEFDSPQKLLEIEDGHFRALLDESEDRDALYAMVHTANGK